MSTMARLYQFYSYYFGMYIQSYEDTILDLAKMERNHKKEKLSNQLKLSRSSSTFSETTLDSELEDIKEIEEELLNDPEKKKLFNSKFYKRLKNDLDAEDDNIINTSSKQKKPDFLDDLEEVAEEEMKLKEEEESKNLKTIPNKTLMKIKIELKETSILFPLDDTKSKTKVLRFKFNSSCNINMDSEFDTIINGNNQLIRTNYKSNNMKLSAKCIEIEFSIVNCRNGAYSIDNICDRMIQ